MASNRTTGMMIRPHPRFPKWLVCEDGTIIGPRGKPLKWDNGEYPGVCIGNPNNKIRIHIAVAETYLGPKPFPSAMVLHKDSDKRNCHFTNLKWGTGTENNNDRYKKKVG